MNFSMFDWKHLEFSRRFKNQKFPSFIPAPAVCFCHLLFCWFQCSSCSAGTVDFHWGLESTEIRVPKCATESKGDAGLQQPTVRIWNRLWFGEDFHLRKNRSVIKKRKYSVWGKKIIKATLEETTALIMFHRTYRSSFIYLYISISL